MQQLFTLLLIAAFTGSASAQRGTGQAAGFPTIGQPSATKASTQNQQSYEDLIYEADQLYNRQEYNKAARLYNEALRLKDDRYPKDQLLRIEAEQARLEKKPATVSETSTQTENTLKDQQQKEQIRQLWEKQHRKNPDAMYTVHFTGLLLSDHFSPETRSHINKQDNYSNFLRPGKYNNLKSALDNANKMSLDGIAVPPGTRLIIYSNNDFTGAIVLDVTGPAVINNSRLENVPIYTDVNTEIFSSDLQTIYPQTVRSWSETNMNFWIDGSLEIIAL